MFLEQLNHSNILKTVERKVFSYFPIPLHSLILVPFSTTELSENLFQENKIFIIDGFLR